MSNETQTRFFVFDSEDKKVALVRIIQDMGNIKCVIEVDSETISTEMYDYGFTSISKTVSEIQDTITKNIVQLNEMDIMCIKMGVGNGLSDVEKSFWYRKGLESYIKNHGKKYLILDQDKFISLRNLSDDVDIILIDEKTFACTNEEFVKIGIKKEIFREVETAKPGKTINNIEDLYHTISKMETKDGHPMLYYVYIGDLNICFTPAELLNIGKWREKLLERCKIVMGLRGKNVRTDFDTMIAKLLESSESVWTDEESEDEMYAAIIMEDVEKLILVDNAESFKRNDMSYMISEEGSLYVKSSTIHQIIKNRNIGLPLSKVREVLRPFLASNTKQIRIEGKRVSTWFFRQRK